MDLARADRDVAAAAADVRARGANVDWDLHRHVAGQRGLREIEAQSESALRDGLARWVTYLTVRRVTQAAEQRRDAVRARSRAVVRIERDVELDAAAILAGLLRARSAGEASAYFAALPDAVAPLREPEKDVRETRAEGFHRLGIEDAALRFVGVGERDLVASARLLIASTEDLAREIAQRRPPWPLALDVRLASDAREGWPSRLGWRSVAELTPGLSLRAAMTGEPPGALGGASFARALVVLGEAFHRTTRPASEPFVVREPPLDPRPVRAGFVLASALAERAFHGRVLGLASGRAADQSRTLAGAFLLAARDLALRVAIRAGDFDELTASVFGAPLPSSMYGAWPPLRDEDLSRFVACLATLDLAATLREREDDDWFRNPRAFETLRDLTAIPIALADDAPARLARRFEELLG